MISFPSLTLNNIYKLMGPKFISPGQTLPCNSTCFPAIDMWMPNGTCFWEFFTWHLPQRPPVQASPSCPISVSGTTMIQLLELQIWKLVSIFFLSYSHLQHPIHRQRLFLQPICVTIHLPRSLIFSPWGCCHSSLRKSLQPILTIFLLRII